MSNNICLTNEKTDNKVDKKSHLERLGLKQEIISGQT